MRQRLLLFASVLGATILLTSSPSASAQSNTIIPDTWALAPRYELIVAFDGSMEEVRISGVVSGVHWGVSDGKPSARLLLSKLMHDVRFELLDSKGVVIPSKITKAGPTGSDDTWVVNSTAFEDSAGMQVRFSYYCRSSTAAQFHVGPPASFLSAWGTDWYPLVANGNDRGTGVMRITAAPGNQIVATGERRLGSGEQSPTYVFDVLHPTYFCIAAAPFSRIQEKSARGVSVALYALKDRPSARNYARGIAQILDVLEKEFGDYPFRDLAIVEVSEREGKEAELSGAATAGMVMVRTSFIDGPLNVAYFAHEITHEWFPLSASLTGEHGRYLADEALAQYGSQLAVEAIEGVNIAEEYRRQGYPGYFLDFSGEGYLRYRALGVDTNSLESLPPGFIGQRMAYSKGMFFWTQLADLMGREKLKQVLQNFWRERRFGEFTWEDLQSVLYANVDPRGKVYLDQWLTRTGSPEWRAEWTKVGNGVEGRIVQVSPFYEMPVEVEIKGTQGERNIEFVWLTGAETKFNFHPGFAIDSVEIDPHFRILHWTPQTRDASLAWVPFMKVDFNPSSEAFHSSLTKINKPDIFGVGFMIEQRWGAFCIDNGDYDCAIQHLTAALQQPTRVAVILPLCYMNLARAAFAKRDYDQALKWVNQAIVADRLINDRAGAQFSLRSIFGCDTPGQTHEVYQVCAVLRQNQIQPQ